VVTVVLGVLVVEEVIMEEVEQVTVIGCLALEEVDLVTPEVAWQTISSINLV